jgi:hypothetical protein
MTVYFGGYLAWTLIGVLAGIEFGLDMMSTFLSGMHSCLENQTRGLFFSRVRRYSQNCFLCASAIGER